MKKAKETNEEADILGRLQERVEKAISMIQELRLERDSLREKLAQTESLQDDNERFQKERSEIRNRIESILSNLESLDS